MALGSDDSGLWWVAQLFSPSNSGELLGTELLGNARPINSPEPLSSFRKFTPDFAPAVKSPEYLPTSPYINPPIPPKSPMSLPDGIYTPVPTYFTDDYQLDLTSQIKQAKTLCEAGIKGLVIAGSMGESIHLTRKERLTLVSTIRAEVPKDFKLILGMPYTNIADTVEEISQAKEVGADYAILLTPGYYGNSLTHQLGIIDFFKRVSDQAALPIVIYHYPGVSNGTEITPKTFQTLKTFKNIVAVKLTHFNMDRYILLTQGNEEHNFKPFTGLGQILVPSLAIGAHGAIDGMSGIFPKCMVHLYELYKAGEIEKAKELQFLVTSANQMIFDINLVGVKTAMKKIYGLGNGKARPPLSNEIGEDVWGRYAEDMERLAEYERSL